MQPSELVHMRSFASSSYFPLKAYSFAHFLRKTLIYEFIIYFSGKIKYLIFVFYTLNALNLGQNLR